MAALLSWCSVAWREVTWAEVSGSVGDLGTFLPLLIGLVQKVNLDLGTTLIITGVYNIVSGWQFGIPMCVQPMKTIAAVALASTQPPLTLSQLLHAGLFVAGCVALLGASRLVDVVNWLVPRPVVRGVQLAVGTKLAMKGIDMALRLHLPAAGGAAAQWRPLLGAEGLLLGGAALALLLVTTIAPRAFAPGTPDAAEDGGLGPRPRDTPFEPLLKPIERRHPAATGDAMGALKGTPTAQAFALEGPGGSSGGSGSGASSSGGGGETSRLLPCQEGQVAGADVEAAAAASAPRAAPASACPIAPRDDCSGEGASGVTAGTPATYGCGTGDVGGCNAGVGGGASCDGASDRRRLPSALLVVLLGLMLAVAGRPGMLAELRLGPSAPALLRPSWSDLREGALRAGLPQLPLTTLNSVIAVTQLADSLFPDRRDASRWRPSAVALSVGLLNAAGCWLGAMPCCHGAGGLAAQYKFGARTGTAPVLLGCLKAALGLLFGSSLAALLAAFPQTLLGALLAIAGVELAAAVRHTRTSRGYTLALLTGAANLSFDNTGSGFLLGLAAAALVAVYDSVVAAAARWAAARGEGSRKAWLPTRVQGWLGGLRGLGRVGSAGSGSGGQSAVYQKL